MITKKPPIAAEATTVTLIPSAAPPTYANVTTRCNETDVLLQRAVIALDEEQISDLLHIKQTLSLLRPACLLHEISCSDREMWDARLTPVPGMLDERASLIAALRNRLSGEDYRKRTIILESLRARHAHMSRAHEDIRIQLTRRGDFQREAHTAVDLMLQGNLSQSLLMMQKIDAWRQSLEETWQHFSQHLKNFDLEMPAETKAA